MDYKEEFLTLLRSTNREGIEDVIENLEEYDFFKAPASSKFHLNYEGGLVEHSVNVCQMALDIRKILIEKDDTLRESLPVDSVIIAGLLHDTCKTDIYKPTIKKTKDRFGMWKEVPGYDVDYTDFPLGHGGKIGHHAAALRTGSDRRRNHGYPLAHECMGPSLPIGRHQMQLQQGKRYLSTISSDSGGRRTIVERD
jgi:Predicted HD-superfamily hydrolase